MKKYLLGPPTLYCHKGELRVVDVDGSDDHHLVAVSRNASLATVVAGVHAYAPELTCC